MPGATQSLEVPLQKTLRHLRTHTRIIEQVLRKAGREQR